MPESPPEPATPEPVHEPAPSSAQAPPQPDALPVQLAAAQPAVPQPAITQTGIVQPTPEGTRISRRDARKLLRESAIQAAPASLAPALPQEAEPSGSEAEPLQAIAAPPHSPGGNVEALPGQAEGAAEAQPGHRYTLSLAMAYQLLGLANPLVCTLTSTIGEGMPIQLSAAGSGIYHPDGTQGAPPGGFGYDTAKDTRTGLLAGSRVLTARGEIAVEHLMPGDAVLTLRGPGLLPITWIGRSVAIEPPVQIAAGAFGPDRPRQALRVAAGHPIFVDSNPVTARDLVNGGTIRSLDTQAAELFHVGVGAAEVMLAEGVPLASAVR